MTHPRLRPGGPALAAALLFSSSAAGQTAAPSVPATPSAQSSEGAPPPTAADVAELREEVRALRSDLDATRQERSPEFLPHPGPKPLGSEVFWPWVTPAEGLSVRGYLQSQYESHQDSRDQLTQNGAILNKDRFSIRRARVNLNGEWEYAAVSLELDANTTNGPQVDLRKAEASLQYRPDRRKPPIVMATAGLFDTPFGYELVESPSTRFFMERSQASLAFFPAEPDVGLRLAGALGFFRWTIATTNGNPMGTGTFQLQDPIKAKDVLFRFGFDAHPLRDLQVAADVSSLRGMGFHPGTAATSASIQWNDLNEDGLVQPYEIVGVPGASATSSQNFPHWAFGADARVSFRTALGVTKVYGEFVLAQNLDRGLYVADPIVTNVDQREMGYYAGIVQEVTRWAVVGLRFDVYDPNLDASDSRGGKLLPFSEAITTWSPMVGFVLPDRARFVLQYDAIDNAFAR
ncbi:MAG TPA: porin, partial [Polyangiaceae bacterium]